MEWLSGETDEGCRLLSESEWEYMARAGTMDQLHFGSDMSSAQANYRENRGGMVPVGSYAANGFGLHDVHGNVWRWREDCWNSSYRGAPRDGSAWVSEDCGKRVFRSGSGDVVPKYLRAAVRGEIYSGHHGFNNGVPDRQYKSHNETSA